MTEIRVFKHTNTVLLPIDCPPDLTEATVRRWIQDRDNDAGDKFTVMVVESETVYEAVDSLHVREAGLPQLGDNHAL